MRLSFTSCQAVSWDVFYVRGSKDSASAFAPFSRVLQYARGKQRGGRDWAFEDFPFASYDMALLRLPEIDARILVVLGEPGTVASAEAAFGDEQMIEPPRPWQAGLRLGRMTRLRAIDGELYAVGEGGQNYRRANGAWPPLDQSFFRPAIDPRWDREFLPPGFHEKRGDKNSYLLQHPDIMRRHTERMLEVHRDNLIYGINGPHADAIYICGRDGLLAVRDDESGFRRLSPLTKNRLLDIAVLDEERIAVCGEGGTVLLGNGRDGFRSLPGRAPEADFRRMAVFEGKIHLAANKAGRRPGGLFVLEGERLRQVETGLDPEPDGLSWLSATDEMLLAVGHKDILRFDGRIWDRVRYADRRG